MDAERIHELFAEFGRVEVRRMFGGAGVFVGERMIALVSRETVYLKADAATILNFEREGLVPFSYATKNGEHKLTSYWRMPERLYDDAEELARWAREAHATALRVAEKKRQSSKRDGAKREPATRPSRQPPKPPGRSRT